MSYKFLSTIQAISATFTGNSVYSNSTPNRTVKLDAIGLYLSRTSDGGYASTITADGSMYYDTRNSHIFRNDGTASMTLFDNTRNVGIGTTTDAGYKLDVNGTARIVGVTTFNNNITQTSGSATFANGILLDSTSRIFSGNTIIYQSNNAASQHYFKNEISNSLSGTLVTIGNGSGAFGTTSASNFLNISGRLATASGTNNLTSILLNHTVENTGTYTGTIRGIYYNPSSIVGTGFTHRAIETVTGDIYFGSTSGNVGIGAAPTSSYKLDVNGTGRFQTSITIGGAADATLFFPNTTSGHQMRIYTQYASNAMVIFANGYNLNLSGGGGMTSNFCTTITGSNGSAALTVQQGNVAWSPVLVVNAIGSTGTRFNTNGNVLIGTTTDAGQKLQLAGNQATTIAGSGDGFNLTRTGSYDNVTLTALATITDTTSNANRAKTGLYVNVTSASTNIAIQTVGAVGVGVTPPSNSFASGYFSYLYAGATVNSAANYNLNVRSTISSYSAGNGGGMSFWGDDRGQAGANTAFAGIRGVKENGTYLNGLGTLTFLTQASSAGLSTESTFAEVGRFTSGGNFLIGTTTNAGYKLDVNGTARVQGVITGSVGSGSLTLGSAAANSQAITITGYFSGNGAISIANSNPRSFNTNLGGQGYGYSTSYNSVAQNQTTTNIYFSATGNINLTDGAIDLNGFNFNPTIISETGATIKAFSSGLNAASNRWNLYINGTAKNYIAGNLLIGSTTDNGYKLQVTGNASVSGVTLTNSLNVQTAAEVNSNEGGNDLLVYADLTSGVDVLYGGGKVKANIYTTPVVTPKTINASATVALMKWYPTTSQGVFIDYVFYVDGSYEMRSGTVTIVNDTSGNAQLLDTKTPDLNGTTAAITFAVVNNGGTMEFQVTNGLGSPVYMNILTRYIPTIY